MMCVVSLRTTLTATAIVLTLGSICLRAAGYFPPPDDKGGWRTITDPVKIRKTAGIDTAKLDEAFNYIQLTSQHGGLLVVRHGGGERDSIGIVDAPVGVEENHDDVIEGLPCQGLSQVEVVRLAAFDVSAGNPNPLSVSAPQVVGGAAADLYCLELFSGPFARSFMRI